MWTLTWTARRRIAAALAVTLAGLAAPAGVPLAAQAVTVGTGPPPSVNPYTAPFGTSGPNPSLAVGQSFVIPAGVTRLDQFQFWVRNDPGVLAGQDFRLLTYRLFVAPFDALGRRVGGPALFVSASTVGTADVTSTAVSFTTGGVAVLPGALYLAFLVPDEPVPPFLPLTPHHGLALGFGGDVYAGGQAYTLGYQAGVDAGPLAGAWTAGGGDFAFSATFAAVPEPATWALVGVGLAATAALGRGRRRRRRTLNR